MSEMVERVARAIARAEKWDNISEKTLSVYLPLARAAIEAMREPTDETQLSPKLPIRCPRRIAR